MKCWNISLGENSLPWLRAPTHLILKTSTNFRRTDHCRLLDCRPIIIDASTPPSCGWKLRDCDREHQNQQEILENSQEDSITNQPQSQALGKNRNLNDCHDDLLMIELWTKMWMDHPRIYHSALQVLLQNIIGHIKKCDPFKLTCSNSTFTI